MLWPICDPDLGNIRVDQDSTAHNGSVIILQSIINMNIVPDFWIELNRIFRIQGPQHSFCVLLAYSLTNI